MYIQKTKISLSEHPPVLSLSDIKAFLRISYSEDDQLLLEIQKAAISYAENFTNLFLQRRIIVLDLKNTDQYQFALIYLPIFSILKITNFSVNNVETIPDNQFQLDREKLKFKNYYPNLQISYLSGYEYLPPLIKHSVLLYISSIYEHGLIEKNQLNQIHSVYSQFKQFKF